MALPEPVPGLVIRYSYLWAREHKRGQDEGVKDRPCAVILVTVTENGDRMVTVLPVTHTPPTDLALAVEIPAAVKRRLRLDDQRPWVVLTEANRFIWPGPDLRPAMPGDAASVSYGPLPFGLFEEIRTKFIGAVKARRASVVPRSEWGAELTCEDFRYYEYSNMTGNKSLRTHLDTACTVRVYLVSVEAGRDGQRRQPRHNLH